MTTVDPVGWLADDDDPTDHLFTDPDDQPAAPIEGVNVSAALKADWHLRRIRAIRRDIAELDAVYHAEMERLRDRHENRRRILEAREAWHLLPVTSWQRMRLERDGLKTIELPHGTLKSRTPTTPTVTVDDPDAVVEWAKDTLPDVVWVEKVTRISKAVLNRYVAQSGEVPPGVTVTPPETTFTVVVED